LARDTWLLKLVYARGRLLLCLVMYLAGAATLLFFGGSGST
jgi:hypothetical protein